MALGVIPPAQAFFLGKLRRSKISTFRPAQARRYPAAVPAGPAPMITTSYMDEVITDSRRDGNFGKGSVSGFPVSAEF